MNTFITGGVGSGTTFMAQLFKEMGHDLGKNICQENNRNEEQQVRGLEYSALRNLLGSWDARFMPFLPWFEMRVNVNPQVMLAVDDVKLAGVVKEQVIHVSSHLPEVVKQPLFMKWLHLWLLAGGTRPDQVIVMMRNTLDQAISNDRDGFAKKKDVRLSRADVLLDYGYLIETLTTQNIPYRVIMFPRCVQSLEYAVQALHVEDRSSFKEIWNRVARPKSVLTSLKQRERYRETNEGYGTLGGENNISALGFVERVDKRGIQFLVK